MGRANPHVPEEPHREHPDMPEAVEDPAEDVNLEDQTADRAGPGPGASKMENLRRIEEQVRVQKERTDSATRPEESPEGETGEPPEEG